MKQNSEKVSTSVRKSNKSIFFYEGGPTNSQNPRCVFVKIIFIFPIPDAKKYSIGTLRSA